jgi:beta propeller repeat protein
MSKSKEMKSTTQIVGLLLCIVLIQTAFAAGNATEDNIMTGNATNENTTIGNATNENATNENATNENTTTGNATVNSINPSDYSTYLLAGGSTQFTVSFTNGGNETLTLTPKVVTTPNSQNNINASWITISPTNATVASSSVQNFNIEINVPSDAESGYYQGAIAFTDDLVPNSTQYVNSMQLGISVQAQPKIELQATSLSDTLEVGKEYDYQIQVKNIAASDITIDPKLNNYNYNPGYSQAFDDDAIEISAPSTIKVGEVANMTIRVHVPENATGYYNENIDMNVDGKANDGTNPQINLYFTVWQQPTVPYVKIFSTTTNAPIMIEVSTDNYDYAMGLRTSPKDKDPSFDLGLIHNSVPVNVTFVKSLDSGNVGVGSSYPVWAMKDGNIYQSSGDHYVETYTVPGAPGNWELTILPKNTANFGYSITVGDTNPIIKGNTKTDNIAGNATADNTTPDNTTADTAAGNTTADNTTVDNTTVASAEQITKIGTGHDPTISGNMVTWCDDSGSIHVYNLTAQNDTTISSSNSSHPAIYGNTIVWHDESSGTPRLTVYDIPSGNRSYITQDVDQYSIPHIYGNIIVWSANYNDSYHSYNVYMRDMSTSKQTQIAIGNSPDIYETKVVYASSVEVPESDYQGIRMYDICTKKAITICSQGDANAPHIYGNKIIWSDYYTRLGFIRMYDISTKKTIDVTSDNTYSGDPDSPDAGDDTGLCSSIYGDKIVYAKCGNDQFGNTGVYMYSIATGQSTPVFNYPKGVCTTPNIYCSTVAWGLDNSYGNNPVNDNGIYVCDLGSKPVASFTAKNVSGTHR